MAANLASRFRHASGLLSALSVVVACGSGSSGPGGADRPSGAGGVPSAAGSGSGGSSAGSLGLASAGRAGDGAAGAVAGAGSGGVGAAGAAGSLGVSGTGAAGASGASGGSAGAADSSGLPARGSIVSVLRKANDYFVAKWPDPGKDVDASHASNIWTRAVYFEGLMALHGVDPQPSDVTYAAAWGTSHAWGLNGGASTRVADNQCAGQTYLDLYALDPQPVRMADIKTNIDSVVASAAVDDWTWVDAIQMAMPVYAKLGATVASGAAAYYDKMYAMYASSRNAQGAAGFYDPVEHLWWRDADFDPPYKEPNGKNCYWSRGNGWVFAALTRVLDIIPEGDAHRAQYLADFKDMAGALSAVQRSDGFWNVSLQDPTHFGGPELTGTALFTYGMAWGVRKGFLPAATYQPVVLKAWTALASAVHDTGFLGYVQGTGKQPSDGQPVTFDSVPNYEDFGTGCFLLGGSEVARLASP